MSSRPGDERERPRRRWRVRLGALALSALFAFAAGELLVRLFVGAPVPERLPVLRVRANPHRGWEMMPGEAHYTYMHPVRMNALGLRGPELPAREPGEVRVLAVGDSLTYGQGVADDETLPRQLEAELARRDGRRWRVVNAGHRGYSTNQELGLVRELGPRIEPDVVLLLWFWNDLDHVDVAALDARLQASGPVAFDANAPLEGRALLEWRAKQLLRRSALVMFVHDALRAVRARPPTREWEESGLARLDEHLAELRALGAERGFASVFAEVPDVAALAGPYRSLDVGARARELAEAHGIPSIELSAPLVRLREETGQLPILLFDGHYDREGNLAMAELLAEWLLEQAPALGLED